ncbi:MAG: TatD family hydrolase [Coriobacteriales bacterium]
MSSVLDVAGAGWADAGAVTFEEVLGAAGSPLDALPLHDAHCHLDFMADGEQVAADALVAGCAIFANTVEPEAFSQVSKRFAPYSNVSVGLGLHPWWVREDPHAQIQAFSEAFEASGTRFVGEVGLDFGKRAGATRDAQTVAFEAIAALAGERGGCTLSIHAVRSAGTVLDILEGAGALGNCTCIFHWFSGSSDELQRAVRAGCLFSVNEMMAASRRGREYIKAIPAAQLLLETDAPPEDERGAYAYERLEASLRNALAAIGELKGR